MTNLKYFSASEFNCNGENCFDKMNPLLLEKLDKARDISGVPFKITSSWRSQEYNKAIKGAKNSSHLRGNAVDILCSNSVERFIIVDALVSAGFKRIGIANRFVHCDVDETLVDNVIWLY